MTKTTLSIIPETIVANKIYEIRGQKIMLDSDLAELYGVATKRLMNRYAEMQIGFRLILCFNF